MGSQYNYRIYFYYLIKNYIKKNSSKKNYRVNVAVNAAIFPDLNCTGLFPSLYNANPFIFVNVLLFPVIGFSPVIPSSNSMVNNAWLLFIFWIFIGVINTPCLLLLFLSTDNTANFILSVFGIFKVTLPSLILHDQNLLVILFLLD